MKASDQTEAGLYRSEARLIEAQRIARIGSWEHDIATGEILWSDEVFRLLEFDQSQGTPSYDSVMQRFHPDDVPAHNAAVQKAVRDGTPYSIDVRVILHDGSTRWIHALGQSECGVDGRPARLYGTLRDVTEARQYERQLQHTNEQLEQQIATVKEQSAQLEFQKAELETANARLEALATTDGLTGLKNHRTFQERLVEEFERSRRYNTALSVLLLDVDNFKAYNDAFGHPAGDSVLKQVAQILQATARTTDLVARYGGEEFVVVLTETDAEGARQAAERYRNTIESLPWPERAVTASFGLATVMPVTTDPSALVWEADRALYRSKNNGRNRVTHAADPAKDGERPSMDLNMYSALMQAMLKSQKDTLVSASESIKEALITAHETTVRSWARILDLRDKETEGHSERVTDMTARLAQSIGLNEDEVRFARWGALLHDIGKIGIPDHVLLKPGPLTDEEWVIMRSHADIAFDILSPIEFLRPALDIPHCHHEKWDGTGYPQGLKGDEIPLAARLFAIVDVWDALCSDRPYRPAWPKAKIRSFLLEQAGKHFDPNAVRVFLQMEETFPEESTESKTACLSA